MAEVRARISCATDNCSSLEPSMDIEFVDVWTDPDKAGRDPDPAFSYAYVDLTTAPPTDINCITQPWESRCRIIINYEAHIHPLWGAARPILDPNTGDPVLDPVTLLPLTNNCTNCHTTTDADGIVRVADGQLDLTDGLSIDEPDQFKSYRELLFTDLLEIVDANGNLVDFMEVIGVDVDGNDILAPVTVNPSMSAIGANASNLFFSRFDSVADLHTGFLSDAEKRLIAEWLDVGAQYYNNPFDAPAN